MLMKTAPRIALYGRHSTAMQTATSSADQAASCMKLVEYLGGTVVATYLDPEQSGYQRDRPGLKKLLRDVETGVVDMVVCEALDRLARDAEDVAFLGKNPASFHASRSSRCGATARSGTWLSTSEIRHIARSPITPISCNGSTQLLGSSCEARSASDRAGRRSQRGRPYSSGSRIG